MDLLGIGMAEVKGKSNPSGGPERSVGPPEKREGVPASRLQEAMDLEVSEKPTRRRFSAEYKIRILKEAEACKQPGELGSLLRREGLYWSSLTLWRKQREAEGVKGLSPKKRGRKKKPADPSAKKIAQLEREKKRLQRKLEQAETIIEIQKKVAALLEVEMKSPESGEGGGSD